MERGLSQWYGVPSIQPSSVFSGGVRNDSTTGVLESIPFSVHPSKRAITKINNGTVFSKLEKENCFVNMVYIR